MSDDFVEEESHKSAQILFQNEDLESTEDGSDEWSSLLEKTIEPNIKKLQYAEGLYRPGSGEICTKYIPMSTSSLLRHVYYKYPAVIDPGVEKALLAPIPTIVHANDGQDLYLDLCKAISTAPVRKFWNSLLTSEIDLSYYGIDPKGFRALFQALRMNKYVEVLNLTDNWMNRDACFHLGEMLVENTTIKELILSGCRIGALGSEALCYFLPYNKTITKLDLSKNKLEGEGFVYLCKAMLTGISVLELNLSYNQLTAKSVISLVEVLQLRNTLTHLDLSWNTIVSPQLIFKLCKELSSNKKFEMLNLSWNSLTGARVGTAISLLIQDAKHIKTVILDNNRLGSDAITCIKKGLQRPSKTFQTLDLSYNPITPGDALMLLEPLRKRIVKLHSLLLDGITVDESFIEARDEILSLKFRKTAIITYGYVTPKFASSHVDIKYLMLKRAYAIGREPKKAKNRVDFALIILQMQRDDPNPKIINSFSRELKSTGLHLPDNLLEGFAFYFAGPRATDKNKSRTVNLDHIVEYIKRIWPDKKLPPTPPPEPVLKPVALKKQADKGKITKKK